MRGRDGRAIHPVVKATGFVSFFTDMCSELVYPLLPQFLTGTLGVSKTMFGLIEGLAEGTPSIVRYVAGSISDRVRNRKWIILAGYSLSLVTKPFIGLASVVGAAAAPFAVLVLRFLDRVGKGIRTAPRDGIVADFSEGAQGRAFGYQRAMDHAGAVTGGLLAFVLVAALKLPLATAIVLSALPGALAILVILRGVRDTPHRIGTPARQFLEQRSGRAREPLPMVMKLYVVSAALFSLANSSDAFLLLRANEMGLAFAMLPLAWVVLHVSKVAASPIGGNLSDRIGRKPLLLGGWLLYAAVYVGFSRLEAHWAAWGLFAVYGVFFGATEGVSKALVADLVPSQARGRAYGLLGMVEGLLLLPTSVFVGWLWDATGSGRLPLALGAGLAAAAALWLAIAVRPPRASAAAA